MSRQRLLMQREIKQHQTQHPIQVMTKEEVERDRLQSFVLYTSEEEFATFARWWCSLDRSDTVEVKFPYERHGLAKRSSNNAKQGVMADFLQFVDFNSQPNGRHTGSHNAQFFFLPRFTRLNPPKPGEKNYELKSRSSIVAEFNRAQKELGRGTCGKTAAAEWLKQHRPKVALHPSMTDYCDTCKAIKEQLSRHQAIHNRLVQSGNAPAEDLLELNRQKELCEEDLKVHREHAAKSRERYREATEKCTQQWQKINEYLQKLHLSAAEQEELHVLQHCFTLVISADYQQAKLIPYWGETEQPSSTYYLQKVSNDIFGITDHRDNHGYVYSPSSMNT